VRGTIGQHEHAALGVAGRGQDLGSAAHRQREVGRFQAGLLRVDHAAHAGAVLGQLADRGVGALAPQHQCDLGVAAQKAQDLAGPRLRALEQRRAAHAHPHAGRIVEHQDRALRARHRCRQIGASDCERARQRERNRRDGTQTGQKQKQLAQPQPGRHLLLRGEQEVHGREAHGAGAAAADQVDQDRHQGGGQSGQKEGRQKVHQRRRSCPIRNSLKMRSSGREVSVTE